MQIDVKVSYKNERMKTLRTASGLSQSQLAQKTGLNVRTLQHYEQGTKDLNVARLSTILKICNALHCRLQDIITEPETLDLLEQYEKA